MTTISEATVKRIEELLEQKNMTVLNLALASCIPHSTIKSILSGRNKNPGIITIKKVCEGLGINLREFYNSELFDQITHVD